MSTIIDLPAPGAGRFIGFDRARPPQAGPRRTGEAGPPADGAATRLLRMLATWRRRALDRRHLAELDERLLRDIGLERLDVRRHVLTPIRID